MVIMCLIILVYHIKGTTPQLITENSMGNPTKKHIGGTLALSIKQNMLWNSAGSLTYLICQWLVTVLVARLSITGYDAAGALAIAMSVSNIFASIGIYKMRSYQISDTNKEYKQSEYVGFRFITIGIGIAVCTLYSIFTCDSSTYITIALYIVFRAGDVLINVFHGIDQINFRMDICGKSMMARGILFLIAFTTVFYKTNNLNIALIAMILTTYPVIAYDAYQAKQFTQITPVFCFKNIKRLLIECFPAVLGTSFFLATTSLSRQFLGLIEGQSALGIYASVCTPVVIIQAMADYIYTPLLGVFADNIYRKKRESFQKLLSKVVLAIIAFGLFSLLGFHFLGPFLLRIAFNQTIADYSFLLYAAAICVSLTALNTFLNELLITLRQMQFISKANLAALLISVSTSIPLIKMFGMNGVSICISIAYLTSSTLMLIKIHKITSQW